LDGRRGSSGRAGAGRGRGRGSGLSLATGDHRGG
jgi:hypothetical protein